VFDEAKIDWDTGVENIFSVNGRYESVNRQNWIMNFPFLFFCNEPPSKNPCAHFFYKNEPGPMYGKDTKPFRLSN